MPDPKQQQQQVKRQRAKEPKSQRDSKAHKKKESNRIESKAVCLFCFYERTGRCSPNLRPDPLDGEDMSSISK